MSFSELKELKEEENVLTAIASKFNDQLNRLKVEELALMNQLRAKKEEEVLSEVTEMESVLDDDYDKEDFLEELDLVVNAGHEMNEGEFEEEVDDEAVTHLTGESDEEEYQDDLKALIKQINARQNQANLT